MMLKEEKLFSADLFNVANLHYQLSPQELIQQTLFLKQGELNETGALIISTGEFTGRSPENRFLVKDRYTEKNVDWNKFNIPIEEKYFLQLKKELLEYLSNKEDVWIRDCYACAHPDYRLNIRVINESPWSNLFVHNLFLRPADNESTLLNIDWQIIQAPGFKADPRTSGTRNKNFTIVSFAHKTILIGGSAYTGEIKKAIFTVLNYILPYEKGVLSMHCSANMGEDGNTAIFFGLSGTGKTTLSSDPKRKLIGDDEHGWVADTIFNFEGGCYAKTINLSQEKEKDIFEAIRSGALVENVTFINGTNRIDYSGNVITENTRVSYPLHFINNALIPSIGKSPENIFFLTCDATGVLPPISKLSTGQAMYHFISGYTAKVAGTEVGITEPKLTFSACFGAPFLPLHPGFYAEMLGRKLNEQGVKVWLINTGWSGGPYGIGKRINIEYTRSMITAALNGNLDGVAFQNHPVFGVMIPVTCPGVPADILNPRNTWADKGAYDKQTENLAEQFANNFKKYEDCVSAQILNAAPASISLN